MAAQLGDQGVVAEASRLERHKGHDALTLEVVGPTHHSRLGHGWMAHQGTFDFHGAQTVATHVDHIVNPAHHPEVTISVTAGPITSEVKVGTISWANLLPVALAEPLRITVHRAHHARPGTANGQIAALIGRLGVAIVIDDVGHNSRQGQGG